MQNDDGNAVISKFHLHLICVSIKASYYVMKNIFDLVMCIRLRVKKIALLQENAAKTDFVNSAVKSG